MWDTAAEEKDAWGQKIAEGEAVVQDGLESLAWGFAQSHTYNPQTVGATSSQQSIIEEQQRIILQSHQAIMSLVQDLKEAKQETSEVQKEFISYLKAQNAELKKENAELLSDKEPLLHRPEEKKKFCTIL